MPGPPGLFMRFLRWFCQPKLLSHIEGDLLELYHERLRRQGKRQADLRFIGDVILLFRPGIIRSAFERTTQTPYGMYTSYFKIGWRNLLRHKGYSLINIGGLGAGMATALLITLWIYDELSFNKYHDHYNTIVQVERSETWDGTVEVNGIHTTGLGSLLRGDTYDALFERVAMVRANLEERVVAVGERKFTQQGYFMQPEGGELFSLRMKYGSRDGLKDMKSILLSASLAEKLFGDIDPVNQVVTMDAQAELKVMGVYDDLPRNTTFHEASYFAPLDHYLGGQGLETWDNYHMYIYAQLRPGINVARASAVLRDIMLPHLDAEHLQHKPAVFLQPMSRWHLYSQFENGISVTSERLRTVWYYGIIGGFILLLACINFMNLSTARSEKRAKEVGIRKSIGSYRLQLIQQFYGESFLMAGLSFVVALALVGLTLPWFNAISDKALTLPWSSSIFWLACVGFTIFTAFLAGSYPALYLSSFSPVKVLKGTFRAGPAASAPRKVLVVIQFSISLMLMIATLVVHQQIQFGKNRASGYTREGLLSLRAASPEYAGRYQVLRQELKNTGMVEEMAEANYPVNSTKGWNGGFSWKGQAIEPSFNTIFVSHEYGKTVGWEFTEGRDFSRDYVSDIQGIVINESALHLLGMKHPVGESLVWGERGTYKILGVVKDMIKGSPFEKTDASIIFLSENDMRWLYMRLTPTVSPHEAIPAIQHVFATLIPSAPFDYTFVDDIYAAKFAAEERIGQLATLFSVLTVVISCLGLFGLASYVAEQRTKEIGIRKVLGASVTSLWQMQSRDFVRLVVIACCVALPLSFLVMQRWLEHYEYHTTLAWPVFVFVGGGALVLTLLVVSYQALRAAVTSPVKSLRSE
ncbi:ABC transporter permease [Fulvivirgaceae bacterium PWU5]|uniref:ABC transporter permease n=1 Tax=Dawidia cretensis TaxID=2782350 RepID=A0AAP2DUL4_9BACT|nr:ABC transporter permease [Dawidia cretensis]MBT1707740.1 ABC transporter permease [Dawidia cretensis]